MIDDTDIKINIDYARNFAERSIKGNIKGVTPDDYYMFLISKFLLLKESMIKKDFENNILYFNIEENRQYLKAIKYIVDYVRKHGVLISNHLEVKILPDNQNYSKSLKSYIRCFHKIRDAFSHGGYRIDSKNERIILDNDNLIPGQPPTKDTYIVRCKLPIKVLELFTYIIEQPKNKYVKEDIKEYKKNINKSRKKFGYHPSYDLNENELLFNYNNVYDNTYEPDHLTYEKNLYEYKPYILKQNTKNLDKDKININTNINYLNDFNDIEEKEKTLWKLIRLLKLNNEISEEQKIRFLKKLQQYGLINLDNHLNNKPSKKKDRNYVKRLVFVCGFNNYFGINEEYDEVNHTMYFENLKDVKGLAKEIICFYSKNDPYVKYEAEKEFADTIATKQIVIDDGGHLNSESGYTEFKELLEYV